MKNKALLICVALLCASVLAGEYKREVVSLVGGVGDFTFTDDAPASLKSVSVVLSVATSNTASIYHVVPDGDDVVSNLLYTATSSEFAGGTWTDGGGDWRVLHGDSIVVINSSTNNGVSIISYVKE